MKKKPKAGFSLFGALIFFVTIAVVVTAAVLLYSVVAEKSGGNNGVIAGVMFCVVLFLSLVCSLIDLFRRQFMIERPVREILEATEKIAAGDFSVRLPIVHPYKRYDEFDCIAENFNKMAEELSRTEVLHNDFISNVSHELKTPLAIIRNYAVLLKNGGLTPAEREQYADTLEAACLRLSALVTNILKLNKLENHGIAQEAEAERFRLDEQLAEAVLGFEDAIERKNLLLSCDLEEIEIYSSPSYLEIVWNNLLSNAVKFTEAGGKIGVSLKRIGENAVVKVSDSGCGISRETGAHVFEKFYQGDTSHAQEGNGLGLALVKKVIDLIGGEISVESEVRKGSTFTVALRIRT